MSTMVLWVDARLDTAQPPQCGGLEERCRLHVTSDLVRVSATIETVQPDVVVFDFDYPDRTGLQALGRAKQAHGSVPFLMVTEHHYENLAVWALRCRVWDYLTRPVAESELTARIELLSRARNDRGGDSERENLMPLPLIPVEARVDGRGGHAHATAPALSYVENHLHEKIAETTVAQLCGMDRYRFSRAFKREHGVTFREYLLKARLTRAIGMLSHTQATVTDVAFSVGFQDLSYFASLFRRNTGLVPSEYRKRFCAAEAVG